MHPGLSRYNERMRFRLAILSVTAVFAVAAHAQAKAAPGSLKDCVPAGYTEVRTYGSVAGADNSKNYWISSAKSGVPNTAISQLSKCSDQRVSIRTNYPNCKLGSSCYVRIAIKTTRACCSVADLQKYGCGTGQTPPTLAYEDTFQGGPDIVRSIEKKYDTSRGASFQARCLASRAADRSSGDSGNYRCVYRPRSKNEGGLGGRRHGSGESRRYCKRSRKNGSRPGNHPSGKIR